MDMMMSFMLGLPSNIDTDACDTKSPRNLSDSDFDAHTQVLPPSRSEDEPTKMLWFIVKERLMPNFSKVCQDALGFKEKTEEEIIELDQDIRKMHTTIPTILRTRALSDSIAEDPFLVMTRIYIEMIYLKSLCVLHRKYMARGVDYSTRCCVEAGRKMVSQFIDMYREFAPGGLLFNERWMLSNFTMNDFLLGVMVLCLVVHIRSKKGETALAIDVATESEVRALLHQSYGILMEKSSVSRDAQRVSHAVRLTLNGAKKATGAWSSAGSLPEAPNGGLVANGSKGMDQALWRYEDQQDDFQENFGQLDPFSFMGNDFERFDWTITDPSTFDLST